MRVIGLAGWGGAGKTTLLERLIPTLIGRRLVVSTLKHAHHAFDIDHPGTDSSKHRQAGAKQVLVASPAGWALLRELVDEDEPPLRALLAQMSRVDIVLIEGFKRENHPKIEVHRAANGKPLLHPDDPSIVAIATDVIFPGLAIPRYHLDDVRGIADVVQTSAVPLEDVRWSQ
jgi:molybdopterin-guanine dinucleotide biosynthesis protein B